jgi:hypothetical protein
MEPEPMYSKIEAAFERFLVAPVEFNEQGHPIGFSEEFLAAEKELAREHITNVGYLVEYVKRLLAKIEELER